MLSERIAIGVVCFLCGRTGKAEYWLKIRGAAINMRLYSQFVPLQRLNSPSIERKAHLCKIYPGWDVKNEFEHGSLQAKSLKAHQIPINRD